LSVELTALRRLGAFSYEASFSAGEELVVLFGHSGAGKSVTLQMIAGLLRPDEGRIVIDGRVAFDSAAGINLPPQERGVGYVVQELALFPHLSVAQNVAYGIPAGVDRGKRTSELLAMLHLDGFEGRRPDTLSGGQRQRVALARALGRDARLLLLDEPFSALDESLRAGMRRELLRLKSELGLTIVFVTHDLREAHLLADHLAVFDEGKLLQVASRDDVFRRPATRRVAELTGSTNIWPGIVAGGDSGSLAVDVAGLLLRCAAGPHHAAAKGQAVEVVIRPERVNIRRDLNLDAARGNVLIASVVEEFAYGNSHVLRFKPEGAGPEIEVEVAARPYEVLGIAGRRRFALELPAEDIHVVGG
jgi:molybdate transport system ATP-binding protein